MPLQIIDHLGFGFSCSFGGDLKIVTKVDNLVIGGDSGVLIFSQCSKIDLSIHEDISPEDGGKVWMILLGFEVLECLLDIGEVGVLQ